jgi:hypothetical protein
MREPDIDDLFARYRAGSPLTIPAGPDAARLVSRHRRRVRLVVVAAVTALAVIVPGVAYTFANPRAATNIGNTPTASPSTSDTVNASPGPSNSPSNSLSGSPPAGSDPTGPAEVPAAAMLRQSDVPAGWTYQGEDIDGDWTFEAFQSYCSRTVVDRPPGRDNRGANFTSSGPSILQMVERFADASKYMAYVRASVRPCTVQPLHQEIVREGFAGDDSLVVETGGEGAGKDTYVFVRVGSLVSQVWYKETTVPNAVLLGQRAAARLCAGVDSC